MLSGTAARHFIAGIIGCIRLASAPDVTCCHLAGGRHAVFLPVGGQGDVTVQVSTVERDTKAAQAVERRLGRVAVAVCRATGNDGYGGFGGTQEAILGRMPRAVVGHLERRDLERCAVSNKPVFGFIFGIAHQKHGKLSVVEPYDNGVGVEVAAGNILQPGLPGGEYREGDAVVKVELLSGLRQREPPDILFDGFEHTAVGQRGMFLSAVEEVFDLDAFQNVAHAANVVGVGMGGNDEVKFGNALPPQEGYNVRTGFGWPGINEDGFPLRRDDEVAIALPDINGVDVE